ncbi:heavy metal transporter [Candidatus Woesearchaeota archaeon]|nr:heavy metal transporter [Candidatus Woesearchaeota archaeon]
MTENKIIKEEFIAEGTTCESCSTIIKKQAMKVEGVKSVEFDYAKEIGHVTFDKTKTDLDTILYKIEEKGYTCYVLSEKTNKAKDDVPIPHKKYSNDKTGKILAWIFGIIGIIIIGYFLLNIVDSINMPQISQNMGYGLLFVVGLLTGFHCVSMCGGFVVSYTAKHAKEGTSSHKSHLMYGLGKTISYTIIGATFGLIGSLIAFTPIMRGVAGIIAGLFLILFGLKMFNVLPSLRKLGIRTPSFIAKFVSTESTKHSSPLYIGLLNGLMIACGPLQAIYIMAAGTGSMVEGAKLLFVFALGTLPVMLGFGYLASYLSSKMTNKILKASGAIVIILGLIMLNNGLVLTGSGYDAGSMVQLISGSGDTTEDLLQSGSEEEVSKSIPTMNNGYQEIRMTVNRYGWEPDKFILKKGVPVKWIIDGQEITGCNNAIQVPKYGLEFDIKQGQQTIEFTPTEVGTVRWSCWMGMIPGTFIVKEDLDLGDENGIQEAQQEINNVPAQEAGSCGGSCGGPSCGAATGGSCGCGG